LCFYSSCRRRTDNTMTRRIKTHKKAFHRRWTDNTMTRRIKKKKKQLDIQAILELSYKFK
jgi:adenosyl cobinamide kinase/adenosyl cobinamide phosphate guanylyltransferase